MIIKKRYIFSILAGCALTLVLGVLVWLLADEAPLDYSALNMELGPADPAVNGFAWFQELAASKEWQNRETDHLDTQYWNNETAEYRLWTEAEMESLLNEFADFQQQAREALARPHFSHYRPGSFDEMAHSSIFSEYTALEIVQAKLLARRGDPDAGVLHLVETGRRLMPLALMPTNLLGGLTGWACIGLVRVELYEMINREPLTEATLRAAMANYPSQTGGMNFYARTLAREMQRLRAIGSAEQWYGSMSMWFDLDLPERVEEVLERYPRLLLKPNKTRNQFFRIYTEAIAQEQVPWGDRETPIADAALDTDDSWRRWLNNNLAGDQMVQMLAESTSGIAEMGPRVEASNRLVYLLMALRLYYEQTGKLPERLDQLVPDYIPAIPLDPFDGQPLRYNRAKRIVYSIGTNGVDSGGSASPSALVDEDEPNPAEYDRGEPTYHLLFAVPHFKVRIVPDNHEAPPEEP